MHGDRCNYSEKLTSGLERCRRQWSTYPSLTVSSDAPLSHLLGRGYSSPIRPLMPQLHHPIPEGLYLSAVMKPLYRFIRDKGYGRQVCGKGVTAIASSIKTI
jgi:hypothetical protein